MNPSQIDQLLQFHFKSHPWHGVAARATASGAFNVYVEVVPTDTVKYEIDKTTGHLKVDRPQKYSSLCPSLYGFIPRTYCGTRVGELTRQALRRTDIEGDGDPLDICVITEKPISHADILVNATPIGGFRMLDRNQADDKIIAVLHNDAAFGGWRDIGDAPKALIERLRHYFLTYKEMPDATDHVVDVTHVYGKDEALDVIERAMQDYDEKYGPAEQSLMAFLADLQSRVSK